MLCLSLIQFQSRSMTKLGNMRTTVLVKNNKLKQKQTYTLYAHEVVKYLSSERGKRMNYSYMYL